ncbi:hypothetical protein MTO96_038931 [Rhipicephalus appendiculatus]
MPTLRKNHRCRLLRRRCCRTLAKCSSILTSSTTVWNISGDVDKFIAKYGRFDRIYSFFCLNWVRDQGQAMRNVSRPPVIRWRVCSRLPSLVPFEDALDEPGTSQSLAQV